MSLMARLSTGQGKLPGVLLYAEEDLQPVARPRHGATPRLLNDLLDAGTARARQQIVGTRLQDMGFEWMAYCTLSLPPQGLPQQACLSTYANPVWLQSYFRHDYRTVDPRQLEPPRSSLPQVWDVSDLEEGLAGHPAPARARQFIDDLCDSGIRSGVFLRIVSPAAQPGEHAVLSLLSGSRDRRWISDAVLGDALTFGLCLHDFLSRHVERPAAAAQGPSGAGLPTMQQEVLRLVMRGLTDKQIADRLHVSAHTVDYHLRQLRQRFCVRNRVQLVHATEHFFASA